jgi:hypothetical protein
MTSTATLDRVREALSRDPEEVGRRVRERLQALLQDGKHVARLRKSYEGAIAGKIRHSREVFPDS